MGLLVYEETSPLVVVSSLLASDAANWRSVIFPDVPGTFRIDNLWVANSDTIDHMVEVFVGTTDTTPPAGAIWFSCNVPLGSGINGVPPVDLFSILGAVPSPGVAIQPAQGIRLRTTVAVNTAKILSIYAIGGML